MNDMELRCPTCDHPIEMGDDDWASTSSLGSVTSIECPNCGYVSVPPAIEETITFESLHEQLKNSKIAHFTLIRPLGEGGFGSVWLAEDMNLGRQVALKLPVSKQRETGHLLHEARAAANLHHPNIVSVYEVGSEDGQVYIASEYIEGLSLRDLLSTGKPGIERTVELIEDVAKALHHAHENGIVHRDVKPANILINAEGQPFVADFGLAKRISPDETISSEGQVLGTARYMSPEQASGKTRETDHRADIYSMGVMLFQMLTGHAPYRGNVRAVLHQKVVQDAPSPRTLDHTLPKDLETICLKCLEREPDKRYKSANEVAEELQRFREGVPIKARPVSSLEKTWRWCKRHRAVAALTAGLILALSCGLIGVSFFWMQAKSNAELMRRSLYRSQMNLAAEQLDKGDIAGVRQILSRFEPTDQRDDLRGFEWYYHDTTTAPFVQVFSQGDVVNDVAISRKGDTFASCGSTGADRSIRVWDTKTCRLIRTLSADSGRFQSLAFSPVSDHLVSGSSDGWVRFWDPLKDNKAFHEIKHGPPISVVRISADGQYVLAAGTSRPVRVWDFESKSLAAEIPTGQSGAVDVRFAPDGKSIVFVSPEGLIRFGDIETGEIARVLNPDYSSSTRIENLALSDDGETIVTGSYRGVLSIWSVADGVLQHEQLMMLGRIEDLEFVKGPLLGALTSGGRLVVYNVEENREYRSLATHHLAGSVLARSGNGERLAVGSSDASIKVLDASELTRPSVFWHDEAVRSLAFLPDGKHLVAASNDGALIVWDITSGKQRSAIATGDRITSMSAQTSGELVATAGLSGSSKSLRVSLWDTKSGKIVDQVLQSQFRIVISFSSTGQQLAIANLSDPDEGTGKILVFDSKDWGKPRFETEEHEGIANALAFSPDDRYIVVGYDNGKVRFIDVSTGVARDHSIHMPTIPRTFAFCEAGTLLAIGTETGEIHLWDVKAQTERNIIKGHTSRINALASLPNGTTIVSCGRDRELKLWDTVSGELLTTLCGHGRQIFCIAVSPSGDTIASGGLEGDIRIWRTRRMR